MAEDQAAAEADGGAGGQEEGGEEQGEEDSAEEEGAAAAGAAAYAAEDTPCASCGSPDATPAGRRAMLLCDRCDAGWHCCCLDPPLAGVPAGSWFCPDCRVVTRARRPPRSGGGAAQ